MKKLLLTLFFLGLCSPAFAYLEIGDLSIEGNLTTTSAYMKLIHESDITVAADELTISGLTGNADKTYLLKYKFISDGGAATYKVRLNNDGASNYGHQYTDGTST